MPSRLISLQPQCLFMKHTEHQLEIDPLSIIYLINPFLTCNSIYFLPEECNKVNYHMFVLESFWRSLLPWFVNFQVSLGLPESPLHCLPIRSTYVLYLNKQYLPRKYRAVIFSWCLLFVSLQVSDCFGVLDLSCPDNFQGVWNCFRWLASFAGK